MSTREIFYAVLAVNAYAWLTPMPWWKDAFTIIGAAIMAISLGRR